MKKLIILTNQVSLLYWSIAILVPLFIAGILYLIYDFKKLKARFGPSKSVMIEPDKIMQLQELPTGRTLIVLRTDRKLPVVQYVEDYQEGMSTNMFANTFYLDKFGKDELERHKTYNIESVGKGEIRVLKQVAMLIFDDLIMG